LNLLGAEHTRLGCAVSNVSTEELHVACGLWKHPVAECSRSTDLDLFGREVLGSTEHIALGAALTAQLMHLHHLAKCNETNESVRRQQTERHLEGFLHTTSTIQCQRIGDKINLFIQFR